MPQQPRRARRGGYRCCCDHGQCRSLERGAGASDPRAGCIDWPPSKATSCATSARARDDGASSRDPRRRRGAHEVIVDGLVEIRDAYSNARSAITGEVIYSDEDLIAEGDGRHDLGQATKRTPTRRVSRAASGAVSRGRHEGGLRRAPVYRLGAHLLVFTTKDRCAGSKCTSCRSEVARRAKPLANMINFRGRRVSRSSPCVSLATAIRDHGVEVRNGQGRRRSRLFATTRDRDHRRRNCARRRSSMQAQRETAASFSVRRMAWRFVFAPACGRWDPSVSVHGIKLRE